MLLRLLKASTCTWDCQKRQHLFTWESLLTINLIIKVGRIVWPLTQDRAKSYSAINKTNYYKFAYGFKVTELFRTLSRRSQVIHYPKTSPHIKFVGLFLFQNRCATFQQLHHQHNFHPHSQKHFIIINVM